VAGAVDNESDTWVATDALGRKVPTFPEVPTPQADRTVGIFYFLWHGAHIQGGPFDVTKILAADPNAMQKPDSPLWGPLHAPHHWGEPLLGYYLTDDEGVLRKHAQMLADAGVDVVIFDVTTRSPTATIIWPCFASGRTASWQSYSAGAFLTPFGIRQSTRELWHDLLHGLHPSCGFRKASRFPADPELLLKGERAADTPAELQPGRAPFTTDRAAPGPLPNLEHLGQPVTLALLRDPAGTHRRSFLTSATMRGCG
jgi:hypothetical protein